MTEPTPEYEARAIVSVEQRFVDFYGDQIPAVVGDDGEIYVPIRPICEFLGADWSAQSRRVRRDLVLKEEVSTVAITATDGKVREMLCLKLEFLQGWLFGFTVSRLKPEIRGVMTRYQRECYTVLRNHFQGPVETSSYATLEHVRAMGLAIASLAEEQMTFNRKVDEQFEVVDVQFEEVSVRLTAVENQLTPGSYVNETQATQISQSVKAVAMKLGQISGRNEYGGVYGELYRKFGITSYKHLPAGRYLEAIEWLTEWHNSIVDEVEF